MPKIQFDVITIFPHILDSYLNESIIKRAQKSGLVKIKTHDLRAVTRDRHHGVDDAPYGGGPGMIYKIEPLYKTLKKIRRKKKSKIVLLSPQGQQFNHKKAQQYQQLPQLILIAGRYEGFDERIKYFIDEELSIGPYVLSGGELPAMVIIEAVTRLIPGVLGDDQSVQSDTFSHGKDYVEYPQYTRPEEFGGLKVPKVLLSGDHQKIDQWRKKQAKRRLSGERKDEYHR